MVWKPDYITLAQAKSYVHVSDTIDDIELAAYITSASRAIDDHCNRQFGKVDTPEQRAYTARYDYERCQWVVDIDDLQTATGLVVTVGGVAITKYTLAPANAVLEGKAWTSLIIGRDAEAQPTGAEYEVLGTATWGWTTTPVSATHATRLQTSRFAARRESPYGVAGSPQLGSELRLLARLDPDVAVSLRGYRRARKAG